MSMVHLKFIVQACLRPLGSKFTVPEKLYVSAAIFIVLVSFLFMISGCSYYKIKTKTSYQSENMLNDIIDDLYPKKVYPRENYPPGNLVIKLFQERQVYALTSSGKWRLESATLSNDTLICKSSLVYASADSVVTSEKPRSYRYHPKTDGKINKQVYLYLKELSFNDSVMVYFPVSFIEQYDIYKGNAAKSIAGPVVITFFLALFILMVVGISQASCGGSCTM